MQDVSRFLHQARAGHPGRNFLGSGPIGRTYPLSLQEDIRCVTSISLPSTVPPSASTACSTCSTRPGTKARSGYPPYNIERTGENAYRVSVAVAGFAENELNIELKENTLTIKGEKQAKTEENAGEVLYQGIAARAFERVFQLADFVQVKGATLENGLLHVDLVREIPETKKPRQIPINTGSNVIEGKVETKVAA